MKYRKFSGIYKITNLINNKVYVGGSTDILDRRKNHFVELKSNRHHNEHLQNSFNKHGIFNFKWELIEECSNEELHGREHYWATKLKAHNNRFGYNIRGTAEENKYSLAKETLIKIGFANSKRIITKETRLKHSERLKKLWRDPKIRKSIIKSVLVPYLVYDKNGLFIEKVESLLRATELYGHVTTDADRIYGRKYYFCKFNNEISLQLILRPRKFGMHTCRKVKIYIHGEEPKIFDSVKKLCDATGLTNTIIHGSIMQNRQPKKVALRKYYKVEYLSEGLPVGRPKKT